MIPLFNSLSSTVLATAVFALCYRMWRFPWQLLVIFCLFFAIDHMVYVYYLPAEAFGIELGIVCSVLGVLVLGVIAGLMVIERRSGQEDGG